MENRKLNILILTYYFPPDANIASRRWAKLGKYLQLQGHQITVLSSEAEKDSISPWDEDVRDLEIFTYKRDYPVVLDTAPKSLFEKIKYKLALRKLKKKITGTIYDRSALVEEIIIQKATEIIRERKIEVLIANGPPHRIMFYGTILKKLFPTLFFVSDFRDPWTWWYNYGYPFLSERNKAYEEVMEAEVMTSSDLITMPALEMKSYLENKYHQSNLVLLPHGFDPDEINVIERKPNKARGSTFRLVYFGNLYDGEKSRFEEVADALTKNANVHLDIFSDTLNYISLFESRGLLNRVKYFNTIPATDLFKRMGDYDAFLYVYPDKFKNIFSSKFYEIIYTGLPVILLSDNGEVSEYIVKNGFGVHLSEQISDKLSEIFESGIETQENNKANLEKFSYKNIAAELAKLILKNSELKNNLKLK